MKFLRTSLARLAGLLRLTRRDAEIDEELRAHVNLLVDDLVHRGHSPVEAHRLAAAEFGSVAAAAEAYRDRRGLPAVEHWLRDCRYALRSLAHNRILTAALLIVLAIGVGLVTTLATLFHAVMFRPLAVPDAGRVVKLAQRLGGDVNRHVDGHASEFSLPEFDLYRSETHALSDVAAVRTERGSWVSGGARSPLSLALVSPNYFHLLQTRPVAGRLFVDADRTSQVVVISHRLWTRGFAQDPNVVSTAMTIDRARYHVVGVAEPSFSGTDVDDVDAWLPLAAAAPVRGGADLLADARMSWLPLIGRLAPGVSLASAETDARAIAARFDGLHPGQRTTILVTPAARFESGVFTDPGDEAKIIGVGVAVALFAGVVLLVCTSNAAALLLARGAARQREFAMRLALGASRRRVFQQLLTESSIVAVMAACVGIVLTSGVLRVGAASLPMSAFFATFVPDATVIVFALAAALGAALLFGTAPAVFATRVDLMPVLKGETTGFGARMPASRLRHWLVSGQVAVSLVLLVIAAALGRNLVRALSVNDGVAWEQLYAVTVDRAPGDDATATRSDLVRRLQIAFDGRRDLATGVGTVGPFAGIGVRQARSAQMSALAQVNFNQVDAGYFPTLGIAPVAGRVFDARDDGSTVVVNASLARKFWNDERAALGQSLTYPEDHRQEERDAVPGAETDAGPVERTATVIGIVPTLRTTDASQLDGPTFYVPIPRDGVDDTSFIVRAPGRVLVQSLVDGVAGARADAAVSITSLYDRLRARAEPMRNAALAIVAIGFLTLFVAGAGIYGIVAHSVVARRQEIGVHIALGAPRARVLRLVLGSSVRAIGAGAVLGLAITIIAGLAASSMVGPTLLGSQALDPTAIAAGLLVLAIITGLAAYLPARRIQDEGLRSTLGS
jgi:putative ABC transport system permease protein